MAKTLLDHLWSRNFLKTQLHGHAGRMREVVYYGESKTSIGLHNFRVRYIDLSTKDEAWTTVQLPLTGEFILPALHDAKKGKK